MSILILGVRMQYLSRRSRAIKPYVAGEQPKDKKYVKLNTNENPYFPSPLVSKVLHDFEAGKLRLYSDPDSSALVAAISKRFGVKKGRIFAGNGSDEVLSMCFSAFFDEGDYVAFADITYSFYKVWAKFNNVNIKYIPLNETFEINEEDYLNLDKNVRGIIICNPNAPTGICMSRQSIIKILEANKDKVVIVDEAYGEFMEYSVVNLVAKYPNLVVVKTMSKAFALAGVRCGFAIADENLIDGLNRVKNSINSYTVNTITQEVCAAAIADTTYYDRVISNIIDTREETAEILRTIGFTVLPSSSNFLFARHKDISGSVIYHELKDNGVLVRHFVGERIDDFVRITIGSKDEMKRLITTLKKIIAENKEPK